MRMSFVEENVNKIFVVVLIGYFFLILYFTNFLRVGTWGDEGHYVETVKFFLSAPFTLETLKTYNEMHPPFAYMMYATAGKLFGDQMFVYRIVTMVTATATFIILFNFFRIFLGKMSALIGVLFFMINPYVFGLSVFVFTDIPGLMFLLSAVLSIHYKKPVLYLTFCSLTILCRQYNVFLPVAVGIWSAYMFFYYQDKSSVLYALYSVLSLVPFGLLALLWGGIAPPLANEYYNSSHEEGFHFNYLITYITILTIYLFPFVIFQVKQFISLKRIWWLPIAGLLYFLFPIRPSIVAINIANVHTIGFVHKVIRKITSGNVFIEDIIFYMFFTVGLFFFTWLVQGAIKIISSKSKDDSRILTLIIFVTTIFMLVMMCSFFVWEKYIVPGLPFFIGLVLFLFERYRGINNKTVFCLN